LVKASKQLVTGGFRLRINARQDLAQNAPHSMKLVNKVKDDRDAFVVDAELLQVVDQMSSGEIDLGKVLGGVGPVGCEPARLNPLAQHVGIDPRLQDEFERFHGHASMACRGL
jgi:hypothetical protein